jgi:hypothetical protein
VEDIEQKIADGAVTYQGCLVIINNVEPILVAISKHMRCTRTERMTIEGYVTMRENFEAQLRRDPGGCAPVLCKSLKFVLDQVKP